MATFRRSTTGCTACKYSYDFIHHPDNVTHLIQRTKPAPRPVAELLAKAAIDDVPCGSSMLAPPGPSAVWKYAYDRNMAPMCSGEILNTLSQPFSGFNQTSYSYSPQDLTGAATWVSHNTVLQACNSTSRAATWPRQDDCGQHREDPDPEGIHAVLCVAPAMDRNLRENTLPFVLQCYSQWAIVAIFEPLKIAHVMKEQIVQQFQSEDSRARCILMANVMDVFGRRLMVDETRLSIIASLTSEVRANICTFAALPCEPIVSELDKRNAMRALDNTLEIVTLQLYTQPMAACIQLMEEAAPAFRLACSELPGLPLSLPDILLEPGLNLRHYATIDIMTSALTGRAAFFKYQVSFSLELCEQIFQVQANSGLYWLHGIPDQFVMLLAWINYLRDIPGASTNSELVDRIEGDLPHIRIAVSQQGDAALRMGRMVVQECWRYAMSIYLYMVLCGANASDPRVIHAQKGFMRLVKGIKPGRNPDAFLVSPMIIAGVATCKERDRDTLRQRVLNLREYTTPHTSGNDAWMQVEDIWARTRSEGRVAVWSDLRIACFRVSGK